MKASRQIAMSEDPAAVTASVFDALHLAMDLGVQLFDVADIYAPSFDTIGHNERLLADAIKAWGGSSEQKSNLILATKGGITRSVGEIWGRDGSYDYLASAAEASAKALNVDSIDLWQHHRLDPSLTFTEQVKNLAKLNQLGVITRMGVSNQTAKQLRQLIGEIGGPADGGVYTVQNQLSPWYRNDMDVIEVCEEFGLIFLPWTPMRGVRETEIDEPVYSVFHKIATQRGVTGFEVANAWLRSLSSTIIPIPGVTQSASVQNSLAGLAFELTEDDLLALRDLPASAPMDAELLRDQPKI